MRTATVVFSVLLLGGCATSDSANTAFNQIDTGGLPATDITLNVPSLTPCTDNPDHSLHLKVGQPVAVLVHGCFGSSGQFRGLAQVLAFHGQQTACFAYDDRARLTRSATELRRAIDLLAEQTGAPQITVIGHSQGALIARKSLAIFPVATASRPSEFRLVTISGPFSGIASAQTCGETWLYPLIPRVSGYLKIDTDERGTCRHEKAGRCVAGDDIFSLAEQRNSTLETDRREQRIEVHAGHVEIVGDKRVAPIKLIAILQEQGVILPTKPELLSAFNQLLARIYQDDSFLTPDAF
jgi:hypothetical protein